MDIFLIIVAGLLLLIGFLGCILPIIPGVPLSYAGIFVLHLTDRVQFSTEFLVLWAIIVLVVQVLDFYIPVWGTKFFGGGRWGRIGSAIGVVVGLFFGPLGIILGPFVGAVLGELLSGRASQDAIKAGFGAFIGFLAGTMVKLVVSGFLIYCYVEALVKM
jgi:uncharacterized protein YqgC (DUF456 family)